MTAPSSQWILVVEDEPSVRRLLEAFLLRRGLLPVAATSGQAGLALLASRPGDYVAAIVDLSLPDGAGEWWIEQYLQLAPHLRVIATSGLPAPPHLRYFLAKPFLSTDLEAALAPILPPPAASS
jgi:DNA-binding NtrC family response regulator